MPVLLAIFLNDVLPIFLVAGVGFVLARHVGIDVRVISRMAFNALSPCLVFTLLVNSRIGPEEAGRLGVFAAASIFAVGAVAWLVTRLLRLDRRVATAFLMVVMFSNTGNYGLSAIMLAFGQDALARGTIYFVVSSVMMYTVGVFLASAGTRTTADALKSIVKVPAVWGAVVALLVLATGWRPPRPIMIGTQALGDAALPVMMLVLGMQFERARRPERPGLVALASLLTLVVQPLLAFGLADLIGLTGTARQASILEASMPAAIVTTILALEYDASPSFVTSVVFITTLLSPLSVTVIIALLK